MKPRIGLRMSHSSFPCVEKILISSIDLTFSSFSHRSPVCFAFIRHFSRFIRPQPGLLSMMRAAFLAFVTISLSISVRSSGLPPSSSAYWGSGTGTRDGRDSALPQGGNIESGPSTEPSLGGVFGRQGERISHVGASSSRKRPDASVGNEHDLGLSLGREGWSEEAVHQANLERAANLRRKFAHYLNYDFVLWPESSINARRYQTSLHKIRTRARSAYRL